MKGRWDPGVKADKVLNVKGKSLWCERQKGSLVLKIQIQIQDTDTGA